MIKDYVRKTPTRITEEEYTDVGSFFSLGTYRTAFLGSTLVITDTPGGAPLVVGTDYALVNKDHGYSAPGFEDEDVYGDIVMLNAAYQTGSIYITYDAVFTYIDKDYITGKTQEDLDAGAAEAAIPRFYGFPADAGNTLSIASSSVSALTALSKSEVAFHDSGLDALRKYRLTASGWEQVGNALTITSSSFSALAALSADDVAFIEDTSEDLRVYHFDGADWAQVGSDFNIPGIQIPSLAALTSTDVALIDNAVEDLAVYRWSGSAWSLVGNKLNLGAIGIPAITALNATDIAFIDNTLDELRVYRFDGSDWAQVGNGYSISQTGYPGLTTINTNEVVHLAGGGLQRLTVYKFDGTDWSAISPGLYPGSVGQVRLAALTNNNVAYHDSSNDELRVYRFPWAFAEPYRPF